MKNKNYSHILDWVVKDELPAHIDLKDRVLLKTSPMKHKVPNPRMKLATSIFIAIAAFVLLSSLVYAIYRLVNDPGLQAVQDAGLVTDLNTTAHPTRLPTQKPSIPPSALMVGQSQTVEGVTMNLEWVYLDSTRLLIGMRFSELPGNVSVGFPSVMVNGQPLVGDRQESKYLESSASMAIYLSNQVLQPEAVGDMVKMQFEIPLLRMENGKETQAAVFQFSITNVPLIPGQTLGFQQTLAVSVNGVEMQLHSFRMTPAITEAVVCPSPASSMVFSVTQASLADNGSAASQFTSTRQAEDQGPFCQQLSFTPKVKEGNGPFTLIVNNDWEFYIDQPTEEQVPGVKEIAPLATSQPIDVQSINQVTVTLDWVFADAKRIAFGYTITGLPDPTGSDLLGGVINVTDAQEPPYGGGYGGSSTLERNTDNPGSITGTWSTILREPLTVDQIDLNIDITLDGSHGVDWNYIIGNIPYPEPGPTADGTGLVPTVIPGSLVGTYHFVTSTIVYPVTQLQPGMIVEANGVQMELVLAELTASYSDYILCYNKPSAADWMIDSQSILTSGIEQASIAGYALISDNGQNMTKTEIALPASSISGENVRCARVEFTLGHSNQPRTFTLTIPTLERSSPEIYPQAELDAAFEKLRAQGIEMTYISMQGIGGGGGTWRYDKLPEGMTEEEAYARLITALGYRMPGPWIFTLKFQP